MNISLSNHELFKRREEKNSLSQCARDACGICFHIIRIESICLLNNERSYQRENEIMWTRIHLEKLHSSAQSRCSLWLTKLRVSDY